MTGPIADIGYLAIGVGDLDAAVAAATSLMGMHVTERSPERAHLALGREHHSLIYTAAESGELDHVGLRAAGPGGLAEARRRVADAGLEMIDDGPIAGGVADGFAFAGPEGFAFHVYDAMAEHAPAPGSSGVRPMRLGHITFNPLGPAAMAAFFVDVLGFRVSDVIDGEGCFLRCNAEHHGIGLLRGRGTLHHSGWQVQSLAELGRLGDLLDEHGRHLLWGPVRHGAGNNIAAYFAEPGGSVIEYYADMEQVYDETTFRPRTWRSDDPKWFARWAPGRPEGFRDFGLRPRRRATSPA